MVHPECALRTGISEHPSFESDGPKPQTLNLGLQSIDARGYGLQGSGYLLGAVEAECSAQNC